jgi:hypothetical protein
LYPCLENSTTGNAIATMPWKFAMILGQEVVPISMRHRNRRTTFIIEIF